MTLLQGYFLASPASLRRRLLTMDPESNLQEIKTIVRHAPSCPD